MNGQMYWEGTIGKFAVWYVAVAFLLGIVLFLGGCGGPQETQKAPAASYGKKISNFDFNGNPVQLHFSKVPNRVIVTQPEAADALLALGAGEAIRVLSLPDGASRVKRAYYEKKLPHANIVEAELDKESAMMEKPDFILGWRRSFRKGALDSMEFWSHQGVPVYIEENSGPIPAVAPFPPCTVKSEMRFIQNMGEIFDKQEKAQAIIDSTEQLMARAAAKAKTHRAKKVLIIEFMGNTIELFGKNILTGDIIQQMGSTVLEYDTPFISKEQLISLDPDRIFLIYHGGDDEKEAAMEQIQEAPVSHMRAVAEGHVVPVPYRYTVAANVHTGDSIRLIYEGLFSESL